MGLASLFFRIKHLLKEHICLKEKKKLLSGKYRWLSDCIKKREKCKEIVSSVVADNGAALQFQESELSRAKNFLPIG